MAVPAYAEFASTAARGEALRLQELRLAAEEDRAVLLLRLDRVAEATAALEAIVAKQPWRERAVELLVTALAQAGRTGHALAALAGYRDRLRDELGLHPSPRPATARGAGAAGHARAGRARPAPATAAPAGRPPDLVRRPGTGARPGRRGGRRRTAGDAGRPGRGGQDAAGPGGRSTLLDPVWWVDLAPLPRPYAVRLRGRRGRWRRRPSGHAAAGRAPPWAAGRRGCWSSTPASTSWPPWPSSPTHCSPPLSGLLAAGHQPGAAGRRGRAGPGRPTAGGPPSRGPRGGAAVRLFLDGARAADPAVAASPPSPRRVADICRALDGLPLAIELAAARIGTLTVHVLADLPDHPLRAAPDRPPRRGRPPPGPPGRRRWSFELLGADEQRLFLRLSVFAAAFDIAAAETVAAGDGLPAGLVADLVARLAEQSMLTRPGPSGVGRYRMLETIRAYAASRLPEAEAERLRRRHGSFMADLAERAEAGLYGPEEAAWVDRVERWLDAAGRRSWPGTPARSTSPCGWPRPSPGTPTGACGATCSPGDLGGRGCPGPPRLAVATRPPPPTPGATAGSRRPATWPGAVSRSAAARRRRPPRPRWRPWGTWPC